MTPSVQIGLSFGLTFGVPMLVGLWELFLLRRDGPPPGRRWDPDVPGPRGPAPEAQPARRRVRELEDA